MVERKLLLNNIQLKIRSIQEKFSINEKNNLIFLNIGQYDGGNDSGYIELVTDLNKILTEEEHGLLFSTLNNMLGYGSWAGNFSASGEVYYVIRKDNTSFFFAEGSESYTEWEDKEFDLDLDPILLEKLELNQIYTVKKGAPESYYPNIEIEDEGITGKLTKINESNFILTTTLDEELTFSKEIFNNYTYLINKN